MNVVIYYQRRFRTEVQREGEGEREEEQQQVNVRAERHSGLRLVQIMPTTTCADEGFALGTTTLSAGARQDLHMPFALLVKQKMMALSIYFQKLNREQLGTLFITVL